jgi:hypothetical protein
MSTPDIHRLPGGAEVRIFAAEPAENDPGAMYVLDVFGVCLQIRQRDDGMYVHVDTDKMPADQRPLIVEVDNAGEQAYGDAHP